MTQYQAPVSQSRKPVIMAGFAMFFAAVVISTAGYSIWRQNSSQSETSVALQNTELLPITGITETVVTLDGNRVLQKASILLQEVETVGSTWKVQVGDQQETAYAILSPTVTETNIADSTANTPAMLSTLNQTVLNNLKPGDYFQVVLEQRDESLLIHHFILPTAVVTRTPENERTIPAQLKQQTGTPIFQTKQTITTEDSVAMTIEDAVVSSFSSPTSFMVRLSSGVEKTIIIADTTTVLITTNLTYSAANTIVGFTLSPVSPTQLLRLQAGDIVRLSYPESQTATELVPNQVVLYDVSQ